MNINLFDLRTALPREEFDYTLLTSVLGKHYSGVRQKIHALLNAGVIIRVKKGLYVFGENYRRGALVKETLANLIYGPSCISLQYALAHYGLIPERVEAITSVTPKKEKAFTTPLGHFTYRTLSIDKYPHGIEQVWLDRDHPVWMASPEKALCDTVVLSRIAPFGTPRKAREFLEEDLRIDRSHWSRFNAGALRRLNTFYRNGNITLIQDVLDLEEAK